MWIATILGFVSRYAIGVVLAVAVAVGAVAGVFYLQKRDAERKLDAIQIEKERLEAAIDAYKVVIAGKDEAIEELERVQKESEQRAADLASLLEEIRSAPASDNGPIAPVLDRSLRGLSGDVVRKQPSRPSRPKGAAGRR